MLLLSNGHDRLVSVAILSPQDNECKIIHSSSFINDGGDCYMYMYKYLYWYNSFILSLKDNYYTFIPSSNVFIGGGHGWNIYIYIYIYIYIWVWFVCDTILYDGVVYLFALSIVCWVSPYLQRIMTTRSFTVVVHLLVVVLIVDWYMYMHILVQFVDTTHVAFLSCMYI